MCSTSFQEQLETRVSAATAGCEDSVVVSTARGSEGLAVAAAEELGAAGFFVDFPPFFFFTKLMGPRVAKPPRLKPEAKGQSASATAQTQVRCREKTVSRETLFLRTPKTPISHPTKPHARKKRGKSFTKSKDLPRMVGGCRKSFRNSREFTALQKVGERRKSREML